MLPTRTTPTLLEQIAEMSPQYLNIVTAIIDGRMRCFEDEWQRRISAASSRFYHPLLRECEIDYIFSWDGFCFLTIEGLEPLITNLVGAKAESLRLGIAYIVTKDAVDTMERHVVLHHIDTPPTHLFTSAGDPRLLYAQAIPWH